MVSDADLISRLREILRSSDLNTTTTGIVRRKLEEDFGIDLSDKKAFIREQVDFFLQGEVENAQEDGEEEQEGGEEGEGSGEDQDEDGEDEEKEQHSTRNGKSNKRAKKSSNEVKKRGGGGGFCKLCRLSPELQEFMGAPEMARTEVVKRLWAYIREKNLQDSNNRRNIICDKPLNILFGVDSINMFQMNKALAKHIWPLESDNVVQVKSVPKEKQKRQQREEDTDEQNSQEKRPKGGKGFLAPLQLSNALVNFLGTGETELSRSDVVKRMWDYIKQNNLQDPSDKRRVICDGKLKELFEVDTFHGFTVSKLLAAHFIKTEHPHRYTPCSCQSTMFTTSYSSVVVCRMVIIDSIHTKPYFYTANVAASKPFCSHRFIPKITVSRKDTVSMKESTEFFAIKNGKEGVSVLGQEAFIDGSPEERSYFAADELEQV